MDNGFKYIFEAVENNLGSRVRLHYLQLNGFFPIKKLKFVAMYATDDGYDIIKNKFGSDGIIYMDLTHTECINGCSWTSR